MLLALVVLVMAGLLVELNIEDEFSDWDNAVEDEEFREWVGVNESLFTCLSLMLINAICVVGEGLGPGLVVNCWFNAGFVSSIFFINKKFY